MQTTTSQMTEEKSRRFPFYHTGRIWARGERVCWPIGSQNLRCQVGSGMWIRPRPSVQGLNSRVCESAACARGLRRNSRPTAMRAYFVWELLDGCRDEARGARNGSHGERACGWECTVHVQYSVVHGGPHVRSGVQVRLPMQRSRGLFISCSQYW